MQIPIFPDPRDGRPDLLIVAGEHSGDEHAARLVRELKQLHPELKIAALGGSALAREGVDVIYDMTRVSVVGFFEVLKHFGFFRQLFDAILAWIEQWKPHHICFVDYPGMNLRLAEALRKRGFSRKGGGKIGTHFYISPQVWAWKAKRRFKMARTLDRLGVIFPFEEACFTDTDLPTEFVGHPFVQKDYALPLRFDPEAPVLLLPGSRVAAVGRIFPVLLDAFERLLKRQPEARARVVFPEGKIHELLLAELAQRPVLQERVELVSNETACITGSRVLMSSGTFSLVGALAAIPGAIVYRLHPVSYWMGRLLVKIRFIGIANILVNRAIYPEFIQGAAEPERLAVELAEAATPERIAAAAANARELRELLRPDANHSAARWLAVGMGLSD